MLTQETQGRLTVFILLGRFNRIEGWVMPPVLLTYRQQKSRLSSTPGRRTLENLGPGIDLNGLICCLRRQRGQLY